MDRHEIETFLTLAEELHFGRTAERLGVSTGRVSQTIKKIERRVGTTLFSRTSRRVALTSVGEQLHGDLEPLHRGIQDAVARATQAARGIDGVLGVGFLDAAAGHVVGEIAETFRRQHPECAVRLRETHLNDLFGPLRDDVVDLLVTRFPVEEPDLTTGPVVISEPTMLAVPAGHRFAARDSINLDDLVDEGLLSIAGVPDYWLDHHAPREAPSGRPIPRGAVASTFEEALTLVSRGEGLCPVGAQATRYYQRPDIAYVPVDGTPPHQFGLVWRTDRQTGRVLAFARAARAWSPDHEPRP